MSISISYTPAAGGQLDHAAHNAQAQTLENAIARIKAVLGGNVGIEQDVGVAVSHDDDAIGKGIIPLLDSSDTDHSWLISPVARDDANFTEVALPAGSPAAGAGWLLLRVDWFCTVAPGTGMHHPLASGYTDAAGVLIKANDPTLTDPSDGDPALAGTITLGHLPVINTTYTSRLLVKNIGDKLLYQAGTGAVAATGTTSMMITVEGYAP